MFPDLALYYFDTCKKWKNLSSIAEATLLHHNIRCVKNACLNIVSIIYPYSLDWSIEGNKQAFNRSKTLQEGRTHFAEY